MQASFHTAPTDRPSRLFRGRQPFARGPQGARKGIPTLPGLALCASDSVAGEIAAVRFHAEDSGFSVLSVRVSNDRPPITVVGVLQQPRPGSIVTAEGVWVDDARHGSQLRANAIKVSPPSTPSGIAKYLCAFVPGLGPKSAQEIVARFGQETINVVRFQPERLAEVPGLGPVRRQRICHALLAEEKGNELVIFLESFGVSANPARVRKIARKFGSDAIAEIRSDPYRLAREVDGIGFRTADKLARELGFPRDGLLRCKAGVIHVLAEAARDGHCGLPVTELRERLFKECPEAAPLQNEAVLALLRSKEVVEGRVAGSPGIFLPWLYTAEESVGSNLRRLARDSAPWGPLPLGDVSSWISSQTGRTPTRQQLDAIHAAFVNRLTTITGEPGTGKTTVAQAIVRLYQRFGIRFALCAPTGRAAKRLSQVTGESATTVHRLLGFSVGEWKHHEKNPLPVDVVVVDESAMMDLPLFRRLLAAIGPKCALLLLGDKDQLFPVGPGSVFSDVIETNTGAIVRLTEIMRQAQESRIVTAAWRINHGLFPDFAPVPAGQLTDFYFFDEPDPKKILRTLVRVLKERIPEKFQLDPLRDCQVLSPRHDGTLGTKELNLRLQNALNPRPDSAPCVHRGWFSYREGDRVLQISNDYERGLFNGDLGIIEHISGARGMATIRFDEGTVEYPTTDFDQLTPAYAYSVHRAQGSEFPALVLPISNQFGTFFSRAVLYTAVTRAKKLAVLVGERSALARAIENTGGVGRWSGLMERLRSTT